MLAGSKNNFVAVVGSVFQFWVFNKRSDATSVSTTHTRRIESNWRRGLSLIILRHSIIRHNRFGERVMMERMFRLVSDKTGEISLLHTYENEIVCRTTWKHSLILWHTQDN